MPKRANPHSEKVKPAPLISAVLIQTFAAIAVLTLAHFAPATNLIDIGPWLVGLLAAGIGVAVRLPPWWVPINVALPPAAWFLLNTAIPAPVYLAVCVLLGLMQSGAWRNRVPLYLSGHTAIAALLPLLPTRPDFRLLDVGCGTGSVLMPLAAARPDGNYHGIELAPLPFVLSWWRARNAMRPLDIKWGDFWKADLARHDVVYAYLSPAVMPRLWRKAQREMRPGTLLVSNSFTVPGVAPLKTIPYAAHGALYVWRM